MHARTLYLYMKNSAETLFIYTFIGYGYNQPMLLLVRRSTSPHDDLINPVQIISARSAVHVHVYLI